MSEGGDQDIRAGRSEIRSTRAARSEKKTIWPAVAVVAAAAIFGGIIWYAYQSGGGGSSGPPPLIRADGTPVKVKPADPGGQEIPFRDSTVYDRLDGDKQVIEKLLPPPETPADRAPPSQLTETPPPAAATAPAIVVPPPPAAVTQAAVPPANTASPTALAPNLAPSTTITSTTIAPPSAPPASQPASVPPREAATAPASSAKPTSIADLVSRTAPPATAPAGGGYQIQVGSVRTPDAANAEWGRLKRNFPDTLGALTMSSRKVELAGKGTYYRIQAGPLNEKGAKTACDRLKAEGASCIVVKS